MATSSRRWGGHEEKAIRIPAPKDGRRASSSSSSSSSILQARLCLLERSEVGVIVTHPWGPLGGNMSNNVVERVCSRMVQAGMTTLRFNFRGVGGSSGRGSWRGGGEIEDLRTVMAYLREIEGGPKRLILIGYSYGSMISAAVAGMSKSDDSVIASINISYPLGVLWALSFFNTSAMLGRARGCPDMPKLFVIGSSDNFTSSWKLECAVADFPGEQSSTVVHEGLDHFWFGQEDALCDSILEWMAAAI